ncbi:hypothetical protein [Oceanicella sp. SM1341]|uniref:hypothetical protein n=1 Tax=Oceanicella sp. SM1341 TaxID=1548889 RepID=UPI000E4A2D99|nr:hypothetical protein [Oceanicella sp. SM1341]
MSEKELSPEDPRGLISEAYRIEGIGAEDCRSIYFDWALGMPAEADLAALTRALHARLAPAAPDHPMSAVLAEGAGRTAPRPRRRGGRRRG